MEFQSPNLDEMMEKEAVRRRWVVNASPVQVAALTEGQAVVRGEIFELVGSPVVAPFGFLEDAPQQDQLALGQVGVQVREPSGTYRHELHKMSRPFLLRDPTGHVLVRFDENHRDDPDLLLGGNYRFYGDPIEGILIPCAMLGDEVVVAGTVRVAPGSSLAYREAAPVGSESPRMVIEACAVYDVASWALLMRHR